MVLQGPAAHALVRVRELFVDLARLQERLAEALQQVRPESQAARAAVLQAALYVDAMLLDLEQPGIEAPRAAQARLQPAPPPKQLLQARRAARSQAKAGRITSWLTDL